MSTHEQVETSNGASVLLDAREQFLGYIRRRIDDPELAEDLLQESLLRAPVHPESARPIGKRPPRNQGPWGVTFLVLCVLDSERAWRGCAPSRPDRRRESPEGVVTR